MNHTESRILDSIAHLLLLGLDKMSQAQTIFASLRVLPKQSDSNEHKLDALGIALFHTHLNLVSALQTLRVEMSPSILNAAIQQRSTSH